MSEEGQSVLFSPKLSFIDCYFGSVINYASETKVKIYIYIHDGLK